jgi:hypothetical protein
VVAINLPVQVLDGPSRQSVEIFNSAGERVYRTQLPAGVIPGALRLDGGVVFLGQASAGVAVAGLKIWLQTYAGEIPWTWDGRNERGDYVQSGTYTLQLSQAWPDGRRQSLVKDFVVLRAPDVQPGGTLRLGPNPLRGKGPLVLDFDPSPNLEVELRLYNLAGELVGGGQADGASGRLVLAVERLGAGIYLARVRFLEGLAQKRVWMGKFSIVH